MITLAMGSLLAPRVLAVSPGGSILVACSAPAWAEGTSYAVGDKVTYRSRQYEARVAHTPPPGAGWNPEAAGSLWKDLGPCDGGPPPTNPPTAPPTTTPPTSWPPGVTCPAK